MIRVDNPTTLPVTFKVYCSNRINFRLDLHNQQVSEFNFQWTCEKLQPKSFDAYKTGALCVVFTYEFLTDECKLK